MNEPRPPARPEPPKSERDRSSQGRYDAVVFAGGGCRCFWQAGFWAVAQPALDLRPRAVAAVSAGSAFACAALAGILEEVVEEFKKRAERNPKNVYPRNVIGPRPVFPHEQIYRETILQTMGDDALGRLKAASEVRVFLARPPAWLGARSGVLVGMLAYQLDRAARGRVHPTWARRLGFRGEWVSASRCRDGGELADLILQSSCTPPLTPLYRRDGGIVLDGGLVDNVPVEVVEGEAEHTLVLLSRRYPEEALPRIAGRTYLQPSEPIPIEKWDYTSPALVQQTYDLGRRDGEAFVAARA